MKLPAIHFPVVLIILLSLFSSCTQDPANYDSLDPVCFDTQVLPLLQTSCGISGCHDGTEEGFLSADYNSIMESVKPGDPRGSVLYKIITDINNDDMMPPDQPLTKLQRNIIQVWIGQGANETICNTDGNPVGEICFVQDILPMILSSCGTTGCHDAVTREEDYAFTDYNSIVSEGIRPFDPDDSEIYEMVIRTDEERMPPPPRQALTFEQKTALKQWIEHGAQNSDCPSASCDSAGIMSFSTHISPVLQSSCVGCHNSTLANGGVNLSSYALMVTYAQNLRNGTPVILGAIKRLNGFVAMPPTFTLETCKVAQIENWIEQGAGDN